MNFIGMQEGKTNLTSTGTETIRGHVRKNPNHLALVTEDFSETYAEMWERSCRLGNAMLDIGLTKEDLVLTFMPNCYQYLEIVLAAQMIGVPITLGNYRLTGDDIVYQVNDSGATVIYLQPEQYPIINGIKDRLPNLKQIIVVEKDITEGESYLSYEAFLAKGSPDEPQVEVLPEDKHLLFYTSGTTGKPKGAVRTMYCDYNMAVSTAIELSLTKDDSLLLVAPMYAAATAGYMIATLTAGGTLYIAPNFIPEDSLRLIDKFKPTFVFMVPIMYDWALSLPQETIDKYDLSSIRLAVACGAPMHTTIFEKMEKQFKNAKSYNMLGCSELGFVTRISTDEWLRQGRENSIGKPVFDMELKIVDENGKECGVGEVGLLYARSPQTFNGYINKVEGTKEAFLDHEWSTVGDMARVDEDGYYYLVDRSKDMIVTGGTNVYPAEIEGVILQMEGIADVGVIGVPDEKWGEQVKAIVVLKEGYNLSEEEIIAFCKEKLAGFKVPKSVDYIDLIPRNAVGKMLKKDLRKMYWKDTDTFIS